MSLCDARFVFNRFGEIFYFLVGLSKRLFLWGLNLVLGFLLKDDIETAGLFLSSLFSEKNCIEDLAWKSLSTFNFFVLLTDRSF